MKALPTALAIALLLAPVAGAAPRTTDYMQIAHEKWSGSCWPAHVQVVTAWPAWAEDSEALAYPDRCLVQLRSEDWRRMSRYERCETIAHEVGHLAGHNHSRNPRSVMYERMTYKFKPCMRYMRRGELVG